LSKALSCGNNKHVEIRTIVRKHESYQSRMQDGHNPGFFYFGGELLLEVRISNVEERNLRKQAMF